MARPVIVEAVRTPIGKRNGWLSGFHAAELLATAQVEVVKRAGIEPSEVEQIVGGCVTQAGEQASNVTRTAWLSMGLPYETAATTIDCQCGSAQQANHFVANLVGRRRHRRRHRLRGRGHEPGRAGRQRHERARQLAPAGLPLGHARPVRRGGAHRPEVRHHAAGRRRPRVWPRQHKAARAWDEGRFDREVFALEAPVVGPDGPTGERQHVQRDQGLRDTTAEGLAALEARAPRRHAHGRELVADLRRRRRGAVDVRGPGQGGRPAAPGPHRGPGARGLGPLLPPRRPHRRDREGAGQGRA